MIELILSYGQAAHAGNTLAAVQVALLLFACGVYLVQGLRLTLIDVREHRLPDALVLPLFAWLGVPLFAVVILDNDMLRARNTAWGAIFLFGCYWLLRKASRNSLGFGDVKLAGIVGMICGFVSPLHILWATLLAFLLGGAYGLFLVVFRRVSARSHIPFGPFMLAGCALALLTPASNL